MYASQSSVRFRMTSKQQQGGRRDAADAAAKNLTLPRPSSGQLDQAAAAADSEDGCRDLYPVTTLRRAAPSAGRSVSMREAGEQLRRSQQCLPSPNFNIVHRDTEHRIEASY